MSEASTSNYGPNAKRLCLHSGSTNMSNSVQQSNQSEQIVLQDDELIASLLILNDHCVLKYSDAAILPLYAAWPMFVNVFNLLLIVNSSAVIKYSDIWDAINQQIVV